MKVRSVGVGRVWDCMLCTCVSEEGGDGEGESSEAPSLLSCTLFYVSLADFFVSYESIKRELKTRPIYECRYDERLKPCLKGEESARLAYTGLVLELEHLKIETRLISERFANAMGECEN